MRPLLPVVHRGRPKFRGVGSNLVGVFGSDPPPCALGPSPQVVLLLCTGIFSGACYRQKLVQSDSRGLNLIKICGISCTLNRCVFVQAQVISQTINSYNQHFGTNAPGLCFTNPSWSDAGISSRNWWRSLPRCHVSLTPRGLKDMSQERWSSKKALLQSCGLETKRLFFVPVRVEKTPIFLMRVSC
jgi:hypothetical protein